METSWENANNSRGMCRDGCISTYTSNVRPSLVRPIPQDQVTSSLAQQICDIYLKEYIKPSARIPAKLIEYVKKAHEGCITDVKTSGIKQVSAVKMNDLLSSVKYLVCRASIDEYYFNNNDIQCYFIGPDSSAKPTGISIGQ